MRRAILSTLAGVLVTILLAQVALAAGHFAFFDPSGYQAREKARKVVVTVKRDGPVGDGEVDYRTVNGTAKAGSDYVAAQGTLSFAAGETTKTITIRIKDDSRAEGKERFRVKLENGTGMISLLGDPAKITIPPSDQS